MAALAWRVDGTVDSWPAYERRCRELLPAALTVHHLPGTHRSMATDPDVAAVAAVAAELMERRA
ncbi:hypothetical protein [Micromonospora sp. RTGN7]|uniref:hypothetical protein n=1 Tax=Micromonospora sp. RTGN7 TaxID=3016526 RepID=UPI0029FECE61|nr:hypothetical protein [Micromonospora sp. RTGN7]